MEIVKTHIFLGCEMHPIYSRLYMQCMAQTLTSTIYHPVGTCKMGLIDDITTVVDPELRVKGIKRLRIVDGSVMPVITSGNTNAPIIMIGEKAADIIQGIRHTPSVKFKSYLAYYSNKI